MRVLVFSDRAEARRWFERVSRAQGFVVEHRGASAVGGRLQVAAGPAADRALAYVDVAGRSSRSLGAVLRRLESQPGVLAAVIDADGALEDPAQLLRGGAVDYLGPAQLAAGVDPRRLRDVMRWAALLRPAAAARGSDPNPPAYAVGQPSRRAAAALQRPAAAAAELSGSDWTAVRSGREYTFTLMFIEMDNQEALRRDHGSESLAKFQQTFHDTVAALAAPAAGRPWMWSDFGGVLLFPFNGKRCDAVVTGFRLVLNRKLLAIEMYDFEIVPSYRIALHIGATTYHARGETGRIVSDSVNTIFHLGQKFTQPGDFCMTEAVVPFVPAGIRQYFAPVGAFEGHDIWRMRLPL